MIIRIAWLLVCISLAACAFGQLHIDGREYESVAQSDELILYIHRPSATFVVENRTTGFRWTSFVPTKLPMFTEANRLWRGYMSSLFAFSFTDLSDDLGTRYLSNLSLQEYEITVRPLSGGVAFDVQLVELEIALSVEVRIDADQLIVTVPHERITEKADTVLSSISPLPFFGYATTHDSGYFLLPDGCGALYRFKPTGDRSIGDEKRISWYVYSPEEVDFKTYFERSEANLKNAYVPVFGSKFDEDAFVAIISEGDSDAFIHFAESGVAVDASRVGVEFTIRHSFELFLSDISVHGAYSENSVPPIRYDSEPVPVDREITYVFLSGADATYSGMARAYRRYLEDCGTFTNTLEPADIPMTLSIFGGIVEDRLLFDKYVAMTSFGEAATIIEEFRTAGVSSIVANLIGWPRDGYFQEPVIWPPEGKLGGRRGLKKLGAYTDSVDTDLYLSVYNVYALEGNGRFRTRTDVVKEGNTLPVKGEHFNIFLLNPSYIYDRVEKLAERLTDYHVDGLSFEQIGHYLYHDYNDRAPSMRHETMDTWLKTLDVSKEKLGGAAVYGAHIDLAARSDFVFETPVESSGYIVLDESVPFYQMSLHGSVRYSADPANLFHDSRKQYLRWIEYGCAPYYELTYRKSELLAYTGYSQLFTSYYRDWIEIASDQYIEFNTNFGSFFHEPLVDHRYVTQDLVRVQYGEENAVYINYGSSTVQIDGVTVPAEGFFVVTGDDR